MFSMEAEVERAPKQPRGLNPHSNQEDSTISNGLMNIEPSDLNPRSNQEDSAVSNGPMNTGRNVGAQEEDLSTEDNRDTSMSTE